MPFKHLDAIVATDQQDSAMAATHLLRTAGLRKLRIARDGAEALEAARQRTPDFLLLDLALLHDTHLALRAVRRDENEHLRRLPVVPLVVSATAATIAALRDAGANEILVKPLTGEKLVGRIRAMLRTPRAFVDTAAYFGPDRRRSTGENYTGPRRRVSDAADDVFEVA